ncbi:unnamed protein product [Bemisia tabaci]|uniref:Uncharacterized protein n=1 Tax=Bemisia tabaci TaxID=7038 RepID=A0A9P0A2B8_BEMTA|nr:unnamed protein product [Bemisia tabaci]
MGLFIGFTVILSCTNTVLSYLPVEAVIFDMDGLLLNTEAVYFKTHSEICKRFNRTYTKEVQQKVMGMQPNSTAEIIVNILGLNITPEAYRAEYEKLIGQRLYSIDLMPGVRKVTRHLYFHQIPLALATSNTAQFYELVTAEHKHIFNLFERIIIGGSNPEVKNAEPAPDIFLLCLERLQSLYPELRAERVLVFEDSPQGVLGARRAGMQVVMVPDPTLPKEYRVNATKVLLTLNDFVPEEFGLPPYKLYAMKDEEKRYTDLVIDE